MSAEMMSTVKKAFAAYLTRPVWNWSWLVTQTFDIHKCGYTKSDGKLAFHSRLIQESWEVFLDEVSCHAGLVYGFVFGEAHKSGAPHWHAVVHASDGLLGVPRWGRIRERCYDRFGRIRFSVINKGQSIQMSEGVRAVSDGVSRYLCKYVAKDANTSHAWWDFSGCIGGCFADTGQLARELDLDMAFDLEI